MKNLSRRRAIKTAACALAVAGMVKTDLLEAREYKPKKLPENVTGVKLLTNENYPQLVAGDVLALNEDTNSYEGEGWYLWGGKVWKVQLAPFIGGMLTAYQIRGDVMDVDFDHFKPEARVISSYREIKND